MLSCNKTCIWVDADSCPTLARKIILETAFSKGLCVHYVANRNIPFEPESPLFTMHICAANEGEADNFLLSHCAAGDLAVTRDIPLAKRLFEHGIIVLNDRGTIFNSNNLSHLLEERALSLQMQEWGLVKAKRKKTYSSKEAALFEHSFLLALETAQ